MNIVEREMYDVSRDGREYLMNFPRWTSLDGISHVLNRDSDARIGVLESTRGIGISGIESHLWMKSDDATINIMKSGVHEINLYWKIFS